MEGDAHKGGEGGEGGMEGDMDKGKERWITPIVPTSMGYASW